MIIQEEQEEKQKDIDIRSMNPKITTRPNKDIVLHILSGADATVHPCRAPVCSYTPVAALAAVSSVAGVSKLHPPPPQSVLSHPIPDFPVGCCRQLDLRSPVALQGMERLHLRALRFDTKFISIYHFTFSRSKTSAPISTAKFKSPLASFAANPHCKELSLKRSVCNDFGGDGNGHVLVQF